MRYRANNTKEESTPDEGPKRRELFKGQLSTQYTRLANNRFGITAGGIPRFLRYLPPEHLGARTTLPPYSCLYGSVPDATSLHYAATALLLLLPQSGLQAHMTKMGNSSTSRCLMRTRCSSCT